MREGQERADRYNLILPNCKDGRHPARSSYPVHQTEPVLSRLWQVCEKAVSAAMASVRLWNRSYPTGSLLRSAT